METAYIVTGTLHDDMTITLDEGIPLAPMKVRLAVEPLLQEAKCNHDDVIAEIWTRQKVRGYTPRTRDEVDLYLQTERDTWEN